MIIAVSRTAYYAGLDPHATGVPGELGWPEPTPHPRGRGAEYRYTLPPEQADEMADHLATLGASLMYSSEPDDRAEGRACLTAAIRIRAQVVAQS